MQLKTLVFATAISSTPGLLHAQFDFRLAGRNVQVHSFLSEGFAYSNSNNLLTMKTSNGDFFTEGALNISTPITDKFRVGAQVYDRSLGQFGKWKPELDWAMGDYRFTSWFGVRAGKVKTTLGLYNDTQDMPFLHTWALLPQSIYPADLRNSQIAHIGVDIYGSVAPKRLGTFIWTLYAGEKPNDINGGYAYALRDLGINYSSYAGHAEGADLRWITPIAGLTAGASYMIQHVTASGVANVAGVPGLAPAGPGLTPVSEETTRDRTAQFYGQYVRGKFHADAEYRRYFRGVEFLGTPAQDDFRSWYTSAAYRVHQRLEIGAYYSRFEDFSMMCAVSDPACHVYDKVISARVDLTKHIDFKAEGHFVDGNSSGPSARGFYHAQNPNGFQPSTNMLVLRTGFSF